MTNRFFLIDSSTLTNKKWMVCIDVIGAMLLLGFVGFTVHNLKTADNPHQTYLLSPAFSWLYLIAGVEIAVVSIALVADNNRLFTDAVRRAIGNLMFWVAVLMGSSVVLFAGYMTDYSAEWMPQHLPAPILIGVICLIIGAILFGLQKDRGKL